MNIDKLNNVMPSKECQICGKKFVVFGQWAYKLHKNKYNSGKLLYYCSYTCYRKAGGDSGKFKTRDRRNFC